MIVVDRAADRQTSSATANGYDLQTNARLAIPREVDTAEVTQAVIPVDEMPALSAYSAS